MRVSVIVSDHGIQEECTIDVGFLVWQRAATPLDFPSNPSDSVFCTDPITIKAVIAKRKDLIREISQTVAVLLADHICKRDTIDGYKVSVQQSPAFKYIKGN